MNNCPFCNDNRKRFLEKNNYKVKEMYFFENEKFSISPDLSPLVCGHLLVIPTAHYASFGELTDINILRDIQLKVEELLGTDDLLYFEHGAVIESQGGASVDHAHLHVMPRPKDLTKENIDFYITSSGCVHSQKSSGSHDILNTFYKNKQAYIYYKIQNEEYSYSVNLIPHQFLRKMMQKYTTLNYNWRETYLTDECYSKVSESIEYVRTHRK